MARKKKAGTGTFVRTIEGLPVKNMKTKIRLHISANDCKLGKSKAPNACAAALAAKRQVPNCVEARIHIGRVFLKMAENNPFRKTKPKYYWLRGKTPAALRTEIAAFDRGGTFEPGYYNINPLPISDQPAGRRHGGIPKFKRGRPGHHRTKPKVLTDVRGGGRAEYTHHIK